MRWTKFSQPNDLIAAIKDRRQVLIGTGMLLIVGASTALKPRRAFSRLTEGALDGAIPRRIGPYSLVSTTGLVVPAKDELSAQLYDQVLTRIYRAAGVADIGLCIAYGSAQDSGLELHRPEECYPAQGFAIRSRRYEAVEIAGLHLTATALDAARADRVEHLLYWTRIGSVFPPNAQAERGAIYRENLRGHLPDGVLMRLSISDGATNTAIAQMHAFASLLYAAVGETGRRILLGGTAA